MRSYSTLKYICVILCVLLVVSEMVSPAPSYTDYENNIRDLYELLMQKDALEQRLGNHQVVRKSNRSPSLRLRFGRRSDPSLLPVSEFMPVQDQEEK